MKRKFLFSLIFLTLFGTVLAIYLDKIFFPVKLKEIAVDQAQGLLNRKVTIGELHFNPIRGFVVEDINIFNPGTDEIMLQIDRAYFKVVYTALFQDKQFFVPSITIENPYWNLTRHKNGRWDFEDLLPHNREKQNTDSLDAWVGGVSIMNGTVKFTDRSQEEPFVEILNDLQVKTNLSFGKTALFSFAFNLPRYFSKINLKGRYDLPEERLIADIHLERLPLEEYWQFYRPIQNIRVDKGTIQTGKLKLTYQPRKDLQIKGSVDIQDPDIATGPDTRIRSDTITISEGHFTVDGEKLTFKGGGALTKADIVFGPEKQFTGNVTAPVILVARRNGKTMITGDLSISGGDIRMMDTKMTGGIDFFQSSLVWDQPITSFKGRIQLKTAAITWAENKTFKGSPAIEGQLNYDRTAQKFSYAGSTMLTDASLEGFSAALGPLEHLGGEIAFETGILKTEKLVLTALNVPLELQGTLTGFSRPLFNVRAVARQFPLETLPRLLPDLFGKTGIAPAGPASVTLDFKGYPDPATNPKINIQAIMQNATLSAPHLPGPVSALTGEITYTKNLVTWKELRGNLLGQNYSLSGQLVDFVRPSVETSFSSPDFDLTTKFFILRDSLDLAFLKGRYLHSRLNVTGNILTSAWPEPHVGLQGTVELDLKDLPALLPQTAEKFKTSAPEGILTLNGSVSGPFKHWRKLESGLTITGDVSFAGYRIRNIISNFAQANGLIHRFDLTGTFYNGTITANGTADLNQTGIPYQLTLNLDKGDLLQLKEAGQWNTKDLAGLISLKGSLQGVLNDRSHMRGKGSLRIQNGQLGRLNLLTGLGKFLFIPEFGNIVFDEAVADFLITDQRVSTDNLILKSAPVHFLGGGWIDYQKNINFYIRSRFSERTIAQSASLKKLITAFIIQTDNYLHIKVHNTLDEPKYVVVPANVNLIEKATDSIFNGLQTIIEEIP